MNRDHIYLCQGIGVLALEFSCRGLNTTPKLFCDTEAWSRKVIEQNFPHGQIAYGIKENARDTKRCNQESPRILTHSETGQARSALGR